MEDKVNERQMKPDARNRWLLLKKAIHSWHNEETEDAIQSQEFTTFGLINTEQEQQDFGWKRVHLSAHPDTAISLRSVPNATSKSNVTGFNNTGNVRVWPAEEILTNYCLNNKDMFSDKTVCELGGGMTCLAGLMLAATSLPKRVLLTDGNNESIDNVIDILRKNSDKLKTCDVSSRCLQWDEVDSLSHLYHTFDYTICADCLFFEQYHDSLITCIRCLLKDTGVAFMFAPRRGETLRNFCEKARNSFVIEQTERYDEEVWRLHERYSQNHGAVYNVDKSYPIFLTMTMKKD